MYLNKHAIFAANDLPSSDVDMTEEWGGIIKIRMLSAAERLELEELAEKDKKKNQIVSILLKCVVDEHGNRVFEDNDYDMLIRKSSNSLLKVYDAIMNLSNINKKSVDEVAKNS